MERKFIPKAIVNRKSAVSLVGIALVVAILLFRLRTVTHSQIGEGLTNSTPPISSSALSETISSGPSYAALKATLQPTDLPLGSQLLTPPQTSNQLASLLREIRALEPGPEKDAALAIYLGILEPALAGAVIEELLVEDDHVLRDHHIMLLQRLADYDTIRKLTKLIDQANGDPKHQELLLRVFENVVSAAATDGLAEIVRNPSFTFREPLLFYAMRSLARSDNPNAMRSVFERVDLTGTLSQSDLSIVITAAVETTHPAALPTILETASAPAGIVSEASRLIAVYTLRNYRDDPLVQSLLEQIRAGSDPRLAAAATEALTAPP